MDFQNILSTVKGCFGYEIRQLEFCVWTHIACIVCVQKTQNSIALSWF